MGRKPKHLQNSKNCLNLYMIFAEFEQKLAVLRPHLDTQGQLLINLLMP